MQIFKNLELEANMNGLDVLQSMTIHEALLVLGIYRFARQRAQHGELLTMVAADKIAALARVAGIHAERLPSELGLRVGDVWWTTEVLRRASSIVEHAKRYENLKRLETLLVDLRVQDVEGYEEPDDADTSEPAAYENTGVYAIRRQRQGA